MEASSRLLEHQPAQVQVSLCTACLRAVRDGAKTMAIDQVELESFMARMIGHMTGAALCYSIWLGDELGLYRELAGSGPRTADSLAEKTGCHKRLVREWLDGQAAGGLLAYDVDSDVYELSAEAASALADDASPVFVARAMNTFGSMFMDVQKTVMAFRSDGALSVGGPPPVPVFGYRVVFPDRIPGIPYYLMDPGAGRGRAEAQGGCPSCRRGMRTRGIACGDGHRVPSIDIHRIRLPRCFHRDLPEKGARGRGERTCPV